MDGASSALAGRRNHRSVHRPCYRRRARPGWPVRLALERANGPASILVDTISLLPTFRLRLGPSLFHGLVAWGFMYYMLVNFGDVLFTVQ